MKIGFFTNTYLPNIYGLTFSVESFRKGLESLGHEVFVFAPRSHGYQDLNPRVIRYPAIYWKYKIEYSVAFSWYPPINRRIKELGLDIIHVHQPFSVAKDGWRQGRRLGIPVVFTNHTRYEDYTHYVPLIPQKYLKWHVRRAATRFANRCDWVITPSSDIEQIIRLNGVKQPITVLPTGIDWDRYQHGQREKVRAKFGIKPDDTCLIWVGRLEKEKNTDLLLKTGLELAKSDPKVKLLVVGDGSEKALMMRRAKQEGLEKRLLFSGLISYEDLPDYYSAGEIFLQPSLSETQGLTTTEALASGLAVVAIRASGTTDQVRDGVSGILVENDHNLYIQAVGMLAKNRNKQQLLGQAAREMAKQMDYKEKARQLAGIYEKLLP